MHQGLFESVYLPRLERLLHGDWQALKDLHWIEAARAETLLPGNVGKINTLPSFEGLLGLPLPLCIDLLPLGDGSLLDILDESFDPLQEAGQMLLLLQPLEEGINDISGMRLQALGQLSNVANDL